LDIHLNILHSIKTFDLNIPNNLLVLVHYILNMSNHILYLFIYLFEKKMMRIRKQKEKGNQKE